MPEYIKNLNKLQEKIKELKQDGITSKAMLAGAYVAQKWAQANSPVDTGYLRSSAESHETKEGAELVFSASYSYYQEEGTQFMEGRHYVARALDEHEKEILDAIKNQAQKDIESIVKD